MLSAKWQPFCLGLNLINPQCIAAFQDVLQISQIFFFIEIYLILFFLKFLTTRHYLSQMTDNTSCDVTGYQELIYCILSDSARISSG